MKQYCKKRAYKKVEYVTYDIETTDWNKFLIGAVYDGIAVYYSKTAKDLTDHIIAYGKNKIVYAHFGGKFDIKFILQHLRNKYRLIYQAINGGLVRIKVYDGKKKITEIRDSFNILQSGLKNLSKSFKVHECESLKNINWNWYSKMKNIRGGLSKVSSDDLQNYVSVDVIALFEILNKTREMLKYKDLPITIASSAWRFWKRDNDLNDYKTPSANDEYIRCAYYGGRVEVFKRHVKKCKYYDVVSMYPYVMRNKKYPSGHSYKVFNYHPEKLGIYRCEVTSPKYLKYPFLPYRDKDNKLLFPLGRWQGTYTTPEIEKAKSLGYNIKILDGIVWTNKSSPFKEYVDFWFEKKDLAKKSNDTAMTTISKLHLNGLYGKFGQRRKFKVVTETVTQDDIRERNVQSLFDDDLYTMDKEDKRPYTTCHIACFVTSYARIRLYAAIEMVQNKGGEVFYCDTDSVTCDVDLPKGSKLGDLEEQYSVKEAIFLYPKVYVLKVGKSHIIKAKGFNVKSVTWKKIHDNLYKNKPIRTRKSGLIGFFEANRRGLGITEKIIRDRQTRGTFSKRRLNSDSITTEPIYL